MRQLTQRMGMAGMMLVALVVIGVAGCSANAEIRNHAKSAAGQLGRVNVLIDQCSAGSQDLASCKEAKGGVDAVGQSLSDIEKAAK